MPLITVTGSVIRPYGDADVPLPEEGWVDWRPVGPGVHDGSLVSARPTTARIAGGVMEGVELVPGPWKVLVRPEGHQWNWGFTVDLPEGVEPVDLASLAPIIVIDGKEWAKGDPGPAGPAGAQGTSVTGVNDLGGSFSLDLSDGTTTAPVMIPGGEAGVVGIPIFATLAEAEAWEAANPGRQALTIEEPAGPITWTAAAPVFDTAAGEVTIPDDGGATYTINGTAQPAGTYPVTVPSTVTVDAVAKDGYVLAGQTQWVQDFDEGVTAYESVALGLSPELYYRMDDASGVPVNRGTGGVTAQIVGTPTYGVPGIGGFDTSIAFTGDDSRLHLSNLPPAGAPAYSYAAIVKTPASGNANVFEDWGQRNSIKMAVPSFWYGYGPTANRGTYGTIAPSAVYHVALTWDGATSRLYIDGVEVQAVADPGPVAGAAAMRVGNEGTAAATLAGVIMDHTTAYTAAQIKALSDAVVR